MQADKEEMRRFIEMCFDPASPFYKIIGANDMLDKHELRANQFADMGLPFILTGHSHVHNISSITTDSGNTLYDISTGALTGFPPVYRTIEILPDERKIDVKSIFVDKVSGFDTDGLTLMEYTKKLFLGSIADALENAENNYEAFMDFAVGMSLSKEITTKYKFIFQKVSKFLNHLTFGKVRKFVRFSCKVSTDEIKPIYDKKVVPFAIDVVANLYKGDGDIEKSSPEYKIAESVLKKLDKLSKPFSKKLKAIGIETISSAVLPLLHNDGIGDANAVLDY